jgi:hypothetical protein
MKILSKCAASICLSLLAFTAPIHLARGAVTVNQSGSGDFTTIKDAIASGASFITITDNGHYIENVQIGDPNSGGSPVVLTSTQSGTNRPVITPSATQSYVNSRRVNQQAGFGLFANNSSLSNLVLEAQPDLADGALIIVANNVQVENCLFRIAAGTTATLGATADPLVFLGQQGDGAGNPTPGGQDSNGTLFRNCEFIGVAPDAIPLEPIPGNLGYLGQKSDGSGTGQGSGYMRMDVYTVSGEDIVVTFDGCYFHHDRDFGIFPTDLGSNPGSLTLVVTRCRFDANGKFFIRGRGANINVSSSVFSRAGQHLSSDTQNSAVALGYQDGHIPTGVISNCVFVNCGSARYQQAYFGGVNNDSGDLLTVDHCTFVDCVSGVTAGTQTSGASGGSGNLSVSNSIFHEIGDSVPPCTDVDEVSLTNGSPGLVNGLYPAWAYGLTNFVNKWAATFNRYNWNNTDLMMIDNCLVGSIDSEDTRTWDQALADNTQTGARLYAGYPTNFVVGTLTRATPVFVTSDPNAPNAFELTQSSPGQGLGANLAPVLAPRLAYHRLVAAIVDGWSAHELA